MWTSKHSHIYDIRYDYMETLQWEGKTGVGMTPKNIHYYSNKVYQNESYNVWSWNMIYPIKRLQRLLSIAMILLPY